MGTSTVSGPFRSQNGFQELVNGVWTPVGGGGGGGSVTVIPWTPGDVNVYALPAFTEVGQTAQFYWPFHESSLSSEYLVLTSEPIAGADVVFFVAVTVDTTNGVTQNAEGPTSIVVTDATACNSFITATYGGTSVSGPFTVAVINLYVVNTIYGVG
jgi:hypothetical protein